MPGLSGLALHVPKARVPLDAWSAWTNATPEKVRAVVGDAFRVPSGHEDVYTLAANAVLKLIMQADIDPSAVGMLVFATESSQDNAVGGPTVKGLVDLALEARGQPPLSTHLETFEVKQACLAGLNGVLAACRFVALEPDRTAIVVASDIAEYARGSSGEQTQGAGAVAMWVEAKPKLLELDVAGAGRSSADRKFDFRKPARAPEHPQAGFPEARPRDFPTFAGHYSTRCYLDAVDRAFVDLSRRSKRSFTELLEAAGMVLHHRPYDKMPSTSVAQMVLRALRETEDGHAQLDAAAHAGGVSIEQALNELDAAPDVARAATEQGVEHDPAPELGRLLRLLVKSPAVQSVLSGKSSFGRALVRQLGNLYSASLPAWLGAALEEATERPPKHEELLLCGYGSGDAALVVVGRLVDGWRTAARRLGFAAALEGAVDLERGAYERAHDRIEPVQLPASAEVVLERVGDGTGHSFDDSGVPYYGYAP